MPHFRLVANFEVDALVRWRAAINEAHPSKKVSINDCFIKAVAMSLIENPAINCQFVDNVIRRFHSADVSVAVAVSGGLATPVVRNVKTKSVVEIAAEVKDFADRAGRNALKLREISGGSFSISNLGGYGVEQFDAIINPPQCAILAIGCVGPRLTADSAGNARTALMLTCTLSVDHRAIDGAEASKFLRHLRDVVANPDRLA
ncbi:2-oxo acid dehydrogenase subunit E2 [Mesorhizobium sp.]|uniref:2-oxo acid dehydrogenase subunit E2 n=1 Tax=Mesorhizobium sp. TaxID=1871066 RepID=UPI0025C5D9E4|nr:2-oxo acid dehydrogenase subunit E2 [Mesorhizobium sp.]